MATRRISPRRLKKHRAYSIDELQKRLGVHPNTIQNWIADGLGPVDDQRPMLFRGETVIAFLKDGPSEPRRRCDVGELMCLPCGGPKKPDGGMVDFIPTSPDRGRLQGLCPDCGNLMNRIVGRCDLDRMTAGLDVSFPSADSDIGRSQTPDVNCGEKEPSTT